MKSARLIHLKGRPFLLLGLLAATGNLDRTNVRQHVE
jgi:hypothetical protein